jgi:hypothetical protein
MNEHTNQGQMFAFEFFRQGIWDEEDFKLYLRQQFHAVFMHAWRQSRELMKGESKWNKTSA